MDNYDNTKISINAVIFSINNNELKIFLEKREKDPFLGLLELPGGLIKNNETAEDTLRRKISDILGINNSFYQQFFTFIKTDRDPRERIISIGFLTLVNSNSLANNSHSNNWFNINDLDKHNAAFDHKDIIIKAKQYLKNNINHSLIKNFMPDKFPLNDLQKVYEIIEEKKYDNRNFRKKMIISGIVSDCKEKEKSVSHRPATLYKFN